MKTGIVDILLIEDNADEAELAIRALAKQGKGKNLLHLDDGAEAIDFIFAEGRYTHRNINNTPKVIFLDLKLPGYDGLHIIKKLKANAVTKTIPVVVFTSSKEVPDIISCYGLGVNSYVVKPADFTDFNNKVSALSTYWTTTNETR